MFFATRTTNLEDPIHFYRIYGRSFYHTHLSAPVIEDCVRFATSALVLPPSLRPSVWRQTEIFVVVNGRRVERNNTLRILIDFLAARVRPYFWVIVWRLEV